MSLLNFIAGTFGFGGGRSKLPATAPGLRQLAREHTITAQLNTTTQGAYRYGQITARDVNFQPQGRSGDAANLESFDLMHRRVRSESNNNAQIRGTERDFVDLVIGTGMLAYPDPFTAWKWMDLNAFDDSEFDDDIRYTLESDDVFEQWANDPTQCDAEGKLTWWEMQRMALRECVRVGYCLILRVSDNSPGRIVPRCFQLIEREQLDVTKDRPAGGIDGQNKIVNGVEIDRRGRTVAYWILDDHPYDNQSMSAKSTRIEAKRIIPVCLWDRPSETVGVTWFASVGQNTFDRDGFLGAELQTAKKGARLALVAKMKKPGTANFGLDDGYDNETLNPEIKLGNSPIAAVIGTDESVEVVESNRPNSGSEGFITMLDHDFAHAMGLSVYTVTGRYASASFSSANAAKVCEDMHMQPLRRWFANHVAIPVRREINTEAVALGRLETLPFEKYVESGRKFDRFEVVEIARGQLDPEKEGDAAISRLRSGQSTLKRELAAAGLHWIKVALQRAAEKRLLTRLDVMPDFSKGNGGNAADKSNDSTADSSTTATDSKKKAAA